MNDMKYTVFSANWQPGVLKYNWVNWQWAGFTNQNRDWHSGPECTFSKENNWLAFFFQINKYVNLACFLNICKHIMVFLCFSRVKNLHTAPLMNVWCNFSVSKTVSTLTLNVENISHLESLYQIMCVGIRRHTAVTPSVLIYLSMTSPWAQVGSATLFWWASNIQYIPSSECSIIYLNIFGIMSVTTEIFLHVLFIRILINKRIEKQRI